MRANLPRACLLAAAMCLAGVAVVGADQRPGPDPADLEHPFFARLGANGRACASCHHPDDSWTITPLRLQRRFDATDGLDPVFRRGDGANCATADVSTVESRRAAYSLLLAKGLIRMSLPVPAGAEFEVVAVDSPYGCGSRDRLSVYRRPPHLMNFDVLSMVMWDGRHTAAGRSVEDDLAAQAAEATVLHGEAERPPTVTQVHAIVDFQRTLAANRPRRRPLGGEPAQIASVLRGEATFKTRVFLISGVAGFNDARGQTVVVGSCVTCHDVHAAGRRTDTSLLDLGVNEPWRRTPDLPLFTVRCRPTGRMVSTLDPGRALVTGACADLGKIKEPVLRALAVRAPYFHNGSAATLLEVVEFYDRRFRIGLSPGEKVDLVAFLRTL